MRPLPGFNCRDRLPKNAPCKCCNHSLQYLICQGVSALTHSFLGLRQTIGSKKEKEEKKVFVLCLPLQSDIKSGLPTPPSGLGETGTTCCRALMDSLTRCVSGRSKDAIMPVMAVRAKTGTHQDESKRSVRGADDAASRLLRRHKFQVRL